MLDPNNKLRIRPNIYRMATSLQLQTYIFTILSEHLLIYTLAGFMGARHPHPEFRKIGYLAPVIFGHFITVSTRNFGTIITISKKRKA